MVKWSQNSKMQYKLKQININIFSKLFTSKWTSVIIVCCSHFASTDISYMWKEAIQETSEQNSWKEMLIRTNWGEIPWISRLKTIRTLEQIANCQGVPTLGHWNESDRMLFALFHLFRIFHQVHTLHFNQFRKIHAIFCKLTPAHNYQPLAPKFPFNRDAIILELFVNNISLWKEHMNRHLIA